MTDIKQHTWGRRRKVNNSLGTHYRVCEICGVSDIYAGHHSEGGFCEPRPSYAELAAEIVRLKEGLARARMWGISSRNYDSGVAMMLANWVDEGCAGPVPKAEEYMEANND